MQTAVLASRTRPPTARALRPHALALMPAPPLLQTLTLTLKLTQFRRPRAQRARPAPYAADYLRAAQAAAGATLQAA